MPADGLHDAGEHSNPVRVRQPHRKTVTDRGRWLKRFHNLIKSAG
jgi:hypothetical protein